MPGTDTSKHRWSDLWRNVCRCQNDGDRSVKVQLIFTRKTPSCDNPLPRWLDEATKHTEEGARMQSYISVHDDEIALFQFFIQTAQLWQLTEVACGQIAGLVTEGHDE